MEEVGRLYLLQVGSDEEQELLGAGLARQGVELAGELDHEPGDFHAGVEVGRALGVPGGGGEHAQQLLHYDHLLDIEGEEQYQGLQDSGLQDPLGGQLVQGDQLVHHVHAYLEEGQLVPVVQVRSVYVLQHLTQYLNQAQLLSD